MAFPGSIYTPPGVYTETLFERPVTTTLAGLKIPTFIGTGNEILYQNSLQVIRGSSASVDQQVVREDETGRAVFSISVTGEVTLTDFCCDLARIQVRNYPIVSGDGSGTVTTDRSAVSAWINGEPVVVMSVSGANGVIELAQAPDVNDEVRVTYFFNRTDTLITDNLSSQVSAEGASARGQIGLGAGEFYTFTADTNVLTLTVDSRAESSITFPLGSYTAAQVSSLIQGGAVGTLSAASFTNNEGKTAVLMTADYDLVIGSGSANAVLGLVTGYNSSRNRSFVTFQGPIVDGTNGGLTTTDTADVTVKVDGVQVIPFSVDGTNRTVVLPFAPAVGSTVTIQYYFNSWQDTFDYTAHINLTEVLRCGITPDRKDFVDGVDFILKDDKIVWGTSSLVSAGTTTTGYTIFGPSQISTLLVDQKAYLDPCTEVVNTSVSPAVASRTTFQLSNQATTGNGRSTPLGSSLFQSVSNNRIDLPTNRPDLITAYWGFSLQDALDRGPVTVSAVDSDTATITLATPIEVGASVWASYYYNTVLDNSYTFSSTLGGVSGVGRYTITDSDANVVYGAKLGTKSAALSSVTLVFPSGSENKTGARFEGGSGTAFTGPVDEVVTVTFATTESTPAKYSVPGSGPYYIYPNASDKAGLQIDITGFDADIDLDDPIGEGGARVGFFAHLMGEEVVYDSDTGATTYLIDDAAKSVSLTVDGVLLSGDAATGAGTVAAYVTAINTAAAATPPRYIGATRFTSPVTITAGEYDNLSLRYTGDVTDGGAGATSTITLDPGTYNGAGDLVDEVNTQLAVLMAGAYSTGTVTVAAATDADTVTIGPVGGEKVLSGFAGPRTPGSDNFDVSSGVPATIAIDLAAAINDPLNSFTGIVTVPAAPVGAIVTLQAVPLGVLGDAITLASTANLTPSGAALTGGGVGSLDYVFNCFSDINGRLGFEVSKASADAYGYMEFLADGTPAEDFAILAGIDANAVANKTQTKLYDGPIAKRFTVGAGALKHDRIILRNRLLPGSSSISANQAVEQCQLLMQGVPGFEFLGLASGDFGLAGYGATVKAASMVGFIGFAGGQATGYIDARDSQPVVVFYDGTGTTAANNVFKFNVDNNPVTVQFTASDTGVATPVGPASIAGTVLYQIAAAMAPTFAATAAAVVAAGYVAPEGAGVRLSSITTGATSSVSIGTGSANGILGFSDDSSSSAVSVEPKQVASAMMANHAATVAGYITTFSAPTGTKFAANALAGVVEDALGAEYLYIQSQTVGVGSSIYWTAAASNDVLTYGTGLGALVGEGAIGEIGVNGFYVISSDTADGSGTADTSVLNSGTGQDGIVGQTYHDSVTGLTFTILLRDGGISYPDASYFTLVASKTFTTDANIPITLPGTEVTVSNTSGVKVGDTGVVDTFRRSGQEPAVGDLYYVSYKYQKGSFAQGLYTKLSVIEQEMGTVHPDNPLSLASYLSMINGAVVVGLKQVVKDAGSQQASITSYRNAIDDLATPFTGGIASDILVPLRGDSLELYQYLSTHIDLQSSVRYRQERTAIAGFRPAVNIRDAGRWANQLNSTRFRLVYPDSCTLSLTDVLGSTKEFFVEGFYLATALAGSVVSPNLDVATPWTNRTLYGFNQLGRKLDLVEQNTVAQDGVTVIHEKGNVLAVRQGFTTDVTNILTKLPTIIQIVDEVQQQSRENLDQFVGTKFLPGVLTQIEGALGNMFKRLVRQQIISAYTGVSASVNPEDPTLADVSAAFIPVFPLLYIKITFQLRASSF